MNLKRVGIKIHTKKGNEEKLILKRERNQNTYKEGWDRENDTKNGGKLKYIQRRVGKRK